MRGKKENDLFRLIFSAKKIYIPKQSMFIVETNQIY